MTKKIGFTLIIFCIFILFLLNIVPFSFSENTTIFLLIIFIAFISFGTSLLSINAEKGKRSRIRNIHLIIALGLVGIGMLAKAAKIPGSSLMLVLGTLWYCFAFAPLKLKNKYLKWGPFSKTKLETILLSLVTGDFYWN